MPEYKLKSGTKVEIYRSQEEFPDPPEGVDSALVCSTLASFGGVVPAGAMTDDCEGCGIEIVRAPHVPKGAAILCNDCAFELGQPDQVFLSRKNIRMS